MDVARPELGRQAVAFTIEQRQRVVTGGFEVAVVRTLLLFAVNRDLGAVQYSQNYAREIPAFWLAARIVQFRTAW
jgi:hypothetical protein